VIARLRGRLDSAGEDFAVVDVGGVGYLVFCSTRTLRALPRPGEAVDLLVETQVRAESIALYGFTDLRERAWFRLLQTVQGVGARVALAVLGVLGPDDLARAVAAQDKSALVRASGVGQRLSARIVAELKDRLGGLATGVPIQITARAGALAGDAAADAFSALVNLGYGRSEAHAAVSQAAASLGSDATVDALIRVALRELAA
jgi:Holliday junction DNA helicase RuvA